MILQGRLFKMTMVLAPFASAGCIESAFLEAAELFPDTETSSSGAGEAGEPTSGATATEMSPGETGVQTVTGAVDEDLGTSTGSGTSAPPDPESSTGDAVNLPPTIDSFSASDYQIDEAGPLTLTLTASDDQAVVKVRLYLDGEVVADKLTLADFPYVHDVLSAKDNGDGRKFTVEVEDEEGLTATADTPPITMWLPDAGAERCLFEDADKGSVTSVVSAVKYTSTAIYAVGTYNLKLAVWKLDPDDCHALPGWPKTINNWTAVEEYKSFQSLGAAVDLDELGNVVVGGNFLVNGAPRAYVALLSASGSRLWEKAGAPGDELAGVAAGIGLHYNRVFAGGAVRTNDNPVRTDGAVWMFQYDDESVFVGPPTVFQAPFMADEFEKDVLNELNERVRAVVVHPTTGQALVVGERDLKLNPDANYSRTFVAWVSPIGDLQGVPWTSTADASFVHDAPRSVEFCDGGFLLGGWTRDEPPTAEPIPMISWLDASGKLVQRRDEPQLFSTQVRGIACDREGKIVSAGMREFGSHDARVFTVTGLLDPLNMYDSGTPAEDGAVAVACDPRGFCGWGGYRTSNAMPYAVVRVHHP